MRAPPPTLPKKPSQARFRKPSQARSPDVFRRAPSARAGADTSHGAATAYAATALDLPAFEGIARAPAVLAVCVELGKLAAMDAELDRHGLVAGASIYPFCWNVLLAARLVGLGGVLTTFAVRHEPEVLALLGAPDGWALAAVIALGEPVRQPTRLRRDRIADFATVDAFTGPPLVTP